MPVYHVLAITHDPLLIVYELCGSDESEYPKMYNMFNERYSTPYRASSINLNLE